MIPPAETKKLLIKIPPSEFNDGILEIEDRYKPKLPPRLWNGLRLCFWLALALFIIVDYGKVSYHKSNLVRFMYISYVLSNIAFLIIFFMHVINSKKLSMKISALAIVVAGIMSIRLYTYFARDFAKHYANQNKTNHLIIGTLFLSLAISLIGTINAKGEERISKFVHKFVGIWPPNTAIDISTSILWIIRHIVIVQLLALAHVNLMNKAMEFEESVRINQELSFHNIKAALTVSFGAAGFCEEALKLYTHSLMYFFCSSAKMNWVNQIEIGNEIEKQKMGARIVFSFLSGYCFNVVETMYYFQKNEFSLLVLWMRCFWGTLWHGAWSALAVLGLSLREEQKGKRPGLARNSKFEAIFLTIFVPHLFNKQILDAKNIFLSTVRG